MGIEGTRMSLSGRVLLGNTADDDMACSGVGAAGGAFMVGMLGDVKVKEGAGVLVGGKTRRWGVVTQGKDVVEKSGLGPSDILGDAPAATVAPFGVGIENIDKLVGVPAPSVTAAFGGGAADVDANECRLLRLAEGSWTGGGCGGCDRACFPSMIAWHVAIPRFVSTSVWLKGDANDLSSSKTSARFTFATASAS